MEAGTAWVTILPEVKGFGRDLNRQVTAESGKVGDEAGKGLGRSLGSSLVKTVGALGIGLGIGQIVGTGMRTAMDNEMAQIKFTQLLGSTETAKAFITDLKSFAACVDSRTEALTRRGWVGYEQLRSGDEVLALNPRTGAAEWAPVQQVNVYDGGHDVVRMSHGGLDAVVTPNHIWPVRNYKGELVLKVTEDGHGRGTGKYGNALTGKDSLVGAAPYAGCPTEAKFSDAFVELVAWFWTDGTVGTRDGHLRISQSMRANPDKCARIETALRCLYGDPVKAHNSRPGQAGSTWWGSGPNSDGVVVYRLPGSLSDSLRGVVDVAPGVEDGTRAELPTMDFLLSLTRAQLDLFIDVSLAGDGHVRSTGQMVLTQKRRDMAERFADACTLAGLHTRVSWQRELSHSRGGRWRVSILTNPMIGLGEVKRQPSRVDVVWCPTVPGYATWYARRDGRRYFTGNSTPFDFPGLQDAASRFLAVGVEAGRVIPIMTTLGDATALMGTGAQGIDRATTALTQMQQKGKVTGEEMMQLTEAGIPAWDALAASMGKSVPEAQALVSKGLVPADQMFQALETSSGESLQAMSGGMEQMSTTFAGQWSTLKDTATQTLGTLFTPVIIAGAALMGFLNETLFPALGGFGELLNTWRTPIMVVAGIITTLMLPTLVAWAIQAGVTAIAVVTSWATSGAAATAGVARQITSILLLNVQYLRMGVQAMLGAVQVVAAWVLQKAPMLVTMALAVATFAVLIAQWIAMAVAATVNALIVAAAWLIAFWPVALVIAIVIGLIAVIWLFWDEIKAALTKVWNFVKQVFTALWNWITSVFTGIWNTAKSIWESILNTIKTVVNNVISFVTNGFNSLRNAVMNIFNGLKSAIGTVWDAITGIVRKAVQAVAGIGQGIWNGLKGVINTGIRLLNNAIGGFNAIIGAVNKVPGVNIPKIPTIPALADGGIVTRPTLAMIGEAGPEAVIPLSRTGGPTTRGPLVAIENLTMSDPVDVDLLAARLGMLSTAGRL